MTEGVFAPPVPSEKESALEVEKLHPLSMWKMGEDKVFQETISEKKYTTSEFIAEVKKNGITSLGEATFLLDMINRGENPGLGNKHTEGGKIGELISLYLEVIPDSIQRVDETAFVHQYLEMISQMGFVDDVDLAERLEDLVASKDKADAFGEKYKVDLTLGDPDRIGLNSPTIGMVTRFIEELPDDDIFFEDMSKEEILSVIEKNLFQELVTSKSRIGHFVLKLRGEDIKDTDASSMIGWIEQKLHEVEWSILQHMRAWVDSDVEDEKLDTNGYKMQRGLFKLLFASMDKTENLEAIAQKRLRETGIKLDQPWYDIVNHEQGELEVNRKLIELYKSVRSTEVTIKLAGVEVPSGGVDLRAESPRDVN